MKISIDGRSIAAMAGKIRAAKSAKIEQVKSAMYQETLIELAECVERTPLEYGNLRASEHVEGPAQEGNTIVTKIVAGGPSAPYAIYVHEDLEAFHPIGDAKFIESTLNESASFMGERIARRVREGD